MQLYIVRHGIAIDREDSKCPPEAERYLTEEGVEKTKQVAEAVAALGIQADLMFSSPYVRATQTACHFRERTRIFKQKIRRTDSLLPGAEPGAFFARVGARKGCVDSIVFRARAARGRAACRGGRGVATYYVHEEGRSRIGRAKAVVAANGQLVWLITPKLMRKAK